MKKYIKYAIVLFSILCLTACSESFLEGKDSSIIGEDDMNKGDKAATAKAVLNGAYGQIYNPGDIQSSHDDFGIRANMLAMDCMADDIAIPDGFFFEFDYFNDNRSLSYRRTRSTWIQNYATIKTTNEVLSIVEPKDGNDADLDAATEQVLGEALGLRAYAYFTLINLYQQPYSLGKTAPGIPIRLVGESFGGRNTVEKVYDVILSDLTRAYKYLEGKGMKNGAQYINEYAVAGMLARVLPFVNDYPNQWKEVAKYAELATKGAALNTSGLTSGFHTLKDVDVLWGSAISDLTNTYFASFMSSLDIYSTGYAGLGYVMYIDDRLYNQIDAKDIRRAWWLPEDVKDAEGKKVLYKKYAQVKYIDRGGFTSDYIYLRASEMYFVQAEALYLAGDQEGARSVLEAIMATRVEGYATAKTGDALLSEIRLQKRIETWCEGGVRLLDMKWRGEAMDRAGSGNHNLAIAITKLPANPKQWIYQIPQAEIDANDEIEASDNNQ